MTASVLVEVLIFPIFLLAWGTLGITAATGLLLFARWGWALSVAVAALSIPWAPYGTIARILVLWYMMKPEVRAIFAPSAYLPQPFGTRAGTP